MTVTPTVRKPHKASKPSSKAGHKKAEQPSKPGPSTESNQTTQSTEQPSADHARGPSSNIFHKAFRLNETNVCVEAVETVIRDSCEGQCILRSYKNDEILQPHERDTLTDIIVNRCEPTLARGTGKFFSKVAEAINTLMVNENKSIYYIGPHKEGNDSKNPKGKLPDRWRNLMYRLISTGVIEKKRKAVDQDDDDESIELPEELIGPVKWLRTNRKPWDQVKSNWELTHEYRSKVFISCMEMVLVYEKVN